ncbi:CBS domain containing membrane protein [Arcobacter nitrofigilis DSM 7299]|uniref:CBS domain containing membrane protein n=1 Tax=Arcobacter nitrofigilis (strain ATCC 33309 / DSM 7299 / CCUG 15893 / LMG 7604 / NCTC 12251 / CI) TaxID=572480 RepID=D5V0B2_ARCNC|nr:CBS domain-containing protein [Arcobacter nitrofigilis]ADG93724.1 CBS domain containing membrane protein [Arcobacter nitrofigilis DSM 7299]
MFTIYENGIIGVQTTADNLHKVKPIDKSTKEKFSPNDEIIEHFSHKKKNPKNNDEVINSYKKIANMDTSELIYQVKDIMTKDVFTVGTKTTIEEAYHFLKEYDFVQIPVVSIDRKIIGLISKKIILNLLMADIDNVKEILNRKLEDVFLPEVITTDPISDIRRVAKVMIDYNLDAVPVVDDDILFGIISKTDILKAVSHLPKLQLWS